MANDRKTSFICLSADFNNTSKIGFSTLHKEDLVSSAICRKNSMLSEDDVSVLDIAPVE